MSRLEWLQMKRTCASYGPPLTPFEQVELFRLESEHGSSSGERSGREASTPDATPDAFAAAALVG